jgi:hypothetical protein
MTPLHDDVLAGHEARISSLEEARKADSSKLDRILEVLTTLKAKFEVAHTPETCALAEILRELKARVDKDFDDIWKRLRAVESAKDTATGGGKVIYWVLGFLATLLTGIIIGVVVYAITH